MLLLIKFYNVKIKISFLKLLYKIIIYKMINIKSKYLNDIPKNFYKHRQY